MKDNKLFRFEVIVTSKQLGDALALLSGRVAQITPPQLVANVRAKANGVGNVSGEELSSMFGEWLREHKIREFTTGTTREFLASLGRSPNSASYLQTRAKEVGLIKNVGDNATTSRWQVIGARAAAASKRKPSKKSKRTKASAVAS